MKIPEFANPLKFDFTRLTNYRSPERTLEKDNHTWIDAKSSFHRLSEYHIFIESCERRSPDEIEIERVYPVLSEEQINALSSVTLAMRVPSIHPTSKELAIVEAMNIEAIFRTSSVTGRNAAFVYQNHLCFL